MKYVDPDGRWAQLVVGAFIGGASDYAFQVGMNMVNGDDFTTALTNNIDYKSIAVSAATSAAGVGLMKSLNKVRQVVKTANSVQKVLKQEQKMQKAQKARSTLKPNGGNAKPHGGQKHNAAIDNRIREIKEQGGSNIRKNQAQVDANGNKVGNNRPDIQYDMDGVHHTE